MKIAIIVQGRLYGFDLARALVDRGHTVRVFTNYPKWATRRFGLPDDTVHGFWIHGILTRMADKAGVDFTPFLHRLFGRWAASQVAKERWDVIHAFSGVAEEALSLEPAPALRRFVTRGSAHIHTQDRLLAEEQTRSGAAIERPLPWMIAREEREYRKADGIVVLSSFARQSFIDCGAPEAKLFLLPLGVEVERFRPKAEIVIERCRRIRSGDPLHILFVGALSFRKGLLDYSEIVAALAGPAFQFRFVGSIPPESRQAAKPLAERSELIGRQPESELPKWYEWADVFLFPTIEDGFAVVLSQALAAALPVLTTSHCSGPDIVRENESGWVLPIRSAGAFIARLRWCDANREALARMVERIYSDFQPRGWDGTAAAFETICDTAGALTH